MKQTHKKSSYFSLLPLVVVVVIGVVFHQAPPQQPPAPAPDTAKTEPHIYDAPAVHAATIPTGQTETKQQKLARNAPKQRAVANTIVTEYVYRMFGTVNDPHAASDWTHSKANANTGWDIAVGDDQTTIAVIDSGYALAHEDLASQWHVNVGESGVTAPGGSCWTGSPVDKQTNSCDDDANGYVDDWRGWNFVLADNNPQTGRTNPSGDGTAHGTVVAGFAGARGNNGVGSSAINQRVKLMPLVALDDDGIGYTSDIAGAIYYAVDNGASVINLSLGTYANDPAVASAVTYATAHNVVIVAAAGNCGDGSDPDCPPTTGAIGYPASYPDVIAVGATTQGDERASFGSHGKALDISAPGYNLPVSTSWSPSNETSLYASGLYGTSFSSPQVASLVALVRSIRPSTSIDDVSALITATATKPAGMSGLAYTQQLGHGIINAASALSIASVLNSSSGTPVLRQGGSVTAEHKAFAGNTLNSECGISAGTPCTIQISGLTGHKRFLPYTLAQPNSTASWSWSASSLDSDGWEIRARSGEAVSSIPYPLVKKG